MHTCMVLRGSFPPDIRVEKEAKALLEDGHEVSLLCRTVEPQDTNDELRKQETVNGINVHRIYEWKPLTRDIWQKINFDVRFRLPLWEKALDEIVSTNPIDVIHAHDLPTVKSSLAIGRDYNIPVIADFHEIYPAAIRHWRNDWSIRKKIKKNVFSKPLWRYRRLERQCVRQVDHSITISQEAKRYLINKAGGNEEHITIVENMVDLDEFDSKPVETVLNEYNTDYIFTYIGGLGSHRGLELAIKSLPNVLESQPNARFVIIGGTGSEGYGKTLRNLAEEYSVSDRVTFCGWIDFELIPSYIDASDVCIVLHKPSEHTNVAIPHKLSQYMSRGKPVIVTDRPPLKRIIDDASCGIAIPFETEAFADAIVELADSELRDKYGKNARIATEEKYNWDSQASDLLAVYEKLPQTN